MRIVLIHDGLSIDGDSLSRGPLGGTETALIHVARALAQDPDNEVHVFCRCHNTGVYAGVEYHRLGSLGRWASGKVVDVLLSVRDWLTHALPIFARHRVLLSPDAHDQPVLHAALRLPGVIEGQDMDLTVLRPRDLLDDVDEVFCVGHWQADTFVSELGLPRNKLHVTRNGVDLGLFRPRPLLARRKRLLYSSTPFRGLDHLIRLWPGLRADSPDLQLEVCSSMAVYGLERGEDLRQFGTLYEALDAMPACFSRGSLRQADLAAALCAGLIFAYPCTFPETFCIAVAEAQAAGLPVVTSRHSALCERVEHDVDGVLIAGEPGTPDYDRAFREAVRALVVDRQRWQHMSDAGRRKAERLGYGPLAREWTEHFADVLRHKLEPRRPAAAALHKAQLEVPHPQRPGTAVTVQGEQLRAIYQATLGAYGFAPGDN